ncbi:MAG: hypothetical protein HZA32_19010 [Opitutae bacterium]|nr:hypothetical protein [Opitutae bacterium]
MSAALFLAILLAPLIRSDVLFYGGAANHDAFFWVMGAERLRESNYLALFTRNAEHPWLNVTTAIAGWQPGWGRMGSEAWVALCASLTQTSPLRAYLFASAALFSVWLAACYLVIRFFIVDRVTGVMLAMLGAAQPLFAFFHHNENLPNLLGMLAGTTFVLGLEHSFRAVARRDRVLEVGVAAVAFHALLCSYPEMAPFVLLPAGALTLRRVVGEPRTQAWAIAALFSASTLGALINPATTVRAWHGFGVSFASARANTNWANVLGKTEPSEFIPALLSLSSKVGTELGVVGGALASLGLIVAFGFVVARSRDRVGLLALFLGALVLAGYTAQTGFLYGWQKTVQFSAIFIASVLPVGVVALAGALNARLSRAGVIAAAIVFFAYVQVVVFTDNWKWSGRKTLHRDWLDLGSALRDARVERVVIEADTFQWAFFHSMWATYFLRDVTISFAAGSAQSGGYAHESVAFESPHDTRAPRLVSREWADTVGTGQARLLTGSDFALLAPRPVSSP